MEGNNRKAPSVDPKLKARFKTFRAAGGGPAHFKKTRNSWVEEHMYKTSWEEGDVVYRVEWRDEETHDDLLMGRFTDKAHVCHVGKYRVRPWADPVTQSTERRLVEQARNDRAIDLFHGDSQHRDRGRKYRYLELNNGFHEYYFDGLWERGYSKGECDRIARTNFFYDVKRVRTCGDLWNPLYVQLTASEELAPGLFLRHEDTLSGADSDSSQEMKTELLYDLYLTVKADFDAKRARVIADLRDALSL